MSYQEVRQVCLELAIDALKHNPDPTPDKIVEMAKAFEKYLQATTTITTPLRNPGVES